MLVGIFACVTVLLAVLRYGLWFKLPVGVVALTVCAVVWATAVGLAQEACELPLYAVAQAVAAAGSAAVDVCFTRRVTATALTAACVGAVNLLPLMSGPCLYTGTTASALLGAALGWKVFNDVAS